MSEVKVNKITPTAACGTVTLGDSGDTIAIASGVTLTSAGSITNSGTITNTGTISGGTITGTIDNQVNWDTTAKTANFTAVAGNGYFVNTTSAAITVTLPATPSAGDIVGIKDYANTADTNNITIARNGSNIQGTANDYIISTEGLAIALIYVDGTQGWVSTAAAKASDITYPTFITATGGTITTCGDYKIHTFTAPGTFCVSSIGNPSGGPNTVDYVVVAGGSGGGGGNCAATGHGGGGGGAGGFRESHCSANSGCYTASPLATPTGITVTATAFPITVGAGGAGAPAPVHGRGSNGSNSVFSTITSAGGGAGGGSNSPDTPGNSGGNGGGGGTTGGGPKGSGGAGNTPPVSPAQGTSGGPASPQTAGGGGGATDAGTTGGDYPTGPAGFGGDGATTSITGSPVARAGGGGGGHQGANLPAPLQSGIPGGTGGGGTGGVPQIGPSVPERSGTPGTINTGGGGGGGGVSSPPGPGTSGGSGGSGIVIIRYKYQ
ncbi:MAG: hypothetical protein VW646_07695 [Hydrogenophilales bacterium]